MEEEGCLEEESQGTFIGLIVNAVGGILVKLAYESGVVGSFDIERVKFDNWLWYYAIVSIEILPFGIGPEKRFGYLLCAREVREKGFESDSF